MTWEPSPDVIFNDPDIRSAYVRMAHWPEPLGWTLTDIAVPPRHQGQGRGRRLMRRALQWADANGVQLSICIAPAGGEMGYDELEDWYRRVGFEWDDSGMMKRKARTYAPQEHDSARERVAPQAP